MQSDVQTQFYEKNLIALKKRFPVEAELLERVDPSRELKVEVLETGDYALCQKNADTRTTFHPASTYQREQIFVQINEQLAQIKKMEQYLPFFSFLFCGLDAGMRVWYFLNHAPAHCTLYIYERHSEVLKAILTQFDFTAIIESPRVFFFCGADADKRLLEYCERKEAKIPLWYSMTFRDSDKDLYTRVLTEVLKKTKEVFLIAPRVMSGYQNLQKSDIIRAFDPQHRALNILGILDTSTKVMQHVTRDCMNTFRGLGHNTLTIEASGSVSGYYFFKTVDQFKPHMFFQINHLSKEALPAMDNLITVTWVLDPLYFMFNPKIPVESKMGVYDQVLVMARDFMTTDLLKLGFPRERLHHLYFGADIEKYKPVELSDEDRRRYAADISYIGNYHDWAETYQIMPRPFVDDLYAQMVETETFYPEHIKKIIVELERKHGPLTLSPDAIRYYETYFGKDFSHEYVFMVYGWLALSGAAMRMSYLASIGDMGLGIYGMGWEKDSRFARNSRGYVAAGTEASKAFAASKINLHLGSFTNNHPRLFNVIASGGFLLTHLTPEDEGPGGIGDLFEIGKEIEVFRTKKEMREKIEYYLSHESQRRQIALAGYQRLMREHTMAHRMNQALDIVYKGLMRE